MASRGEAFAESHEEPESETPIDVIPGFHRGDIQLTPALSDAPHHPDCTRCPTVDARCDALEAELAIERERNDVLLGALSTFLRQKVGDQAIDLASEVQAASWDGSQLRYHRSFRLPATAEASVRIILAGPSSPHLRSTYEELYKRLTANDE
ncbi:hypothetical protein [Amycolatopsis sp. CA-128772]|uniref:hypothetical protein n=1 Tax=Amycolatopsis sp. CA-128772 TaxID=2073159 RepID=UPI000CD0E9A4|nr:hypothetical protein [Amycolatopsis sp. CA-128772]